MENTTMSGTTKEIQLSNGIMAVLHFQSEYPSLQERMVELLNKYMLKSAQI